MNSMDKTQEKISTKVFDTIHKQISVTAYVQEDIQGWGQTHNKIRKQVRDQINSQVIQVTRPVRNEILDELINQFNG
jgi:hypothetical protein